MKLISLIFLLLTLSLPHSKGQIITKKFLKNGKLSSKTIIFSIPSLSKKEQQKYPDFSENFKEIIHKYWTLNENYKIMNYDDAIKEVKRNKKTSVMAEFVSTYYTIGTAPIGDPGNMFRLVIPKGPMNVAYKALVIFLEDDISKTDIVYSLMLCQYMIKNHDKFKSSKIMKEAAQINGAQLRDKTLLISESELIKLSIEDISAVYPFKFEIVSDRDKEKAILDQNDNYLFIYYSEVATTSAKSEPIKIIFSAHNGAIISWAVSKFSINGIGSRFYLKKKDFKDFVKHSDVERIVLSGE